MILSPSLDEVKPGSICKVKGFEHHLAQVLAAGTRVEMENKLWAEEEGSAPLKKRARIDPENKTPRRPKGSQNKKTDPKASAKTKGTFTYLSHTHTHIHSLILFCLMQEKKSGSILVIGEGQPSPPPPPLPPKPKTTTATPS